MSRAVEIRPNLLSRLPSARVVAGARSMGGVKCEYCSRQFKNGRGLHMHVRTCRKRSVPLHGNFQCGVEAVGQSSSGSAVTETHSGATITSVTMTVAFPQGRKAAGDPVGVTMTSDNPQCRKAAGSPQCREAAGDQTREFNNDYPRGRKVKGSRVRGGVPSAVGSAGSSRAADPGTPRGLAVPGGSHCRKFRFHESDHERLWVVFRPESRLQKQIGAGVCPG